MVKFTGDQVGHRDQVASRPIPPGSGFGSLNKTIGPLNAAVVQVPVEPGQDAIPVAANGSGGVLHRCQSTTDRPTVPAVQCLFGVSECLALLVNLLKQGLDLPGSCCFQAAFRQAVKVLLLPLSAIYFIAQPQVTGLFQQGFGFRFLPSNQIYGLIDDGHNVKWVEGDLGMR